MSEEVTARRISSSCGAILAYLAASKLFLHLLTSGRYGYFCDELYYIACSEHLDWGYVDHPPLIAFITKATRWMLGDSLFALRFFPALAGAVLVILTGLLVRELGGGRFAHLLAGTAVIVVPVYLALHSLMTMNAFEPLFWTLCAYLAVRIVKCGNQKLWLLFGVVAGIGLMNKYSMLFLAFGVVFGLLLTPQRRLLANRWAFLGGLAAFIIVLPNLVWQIRSHWPIIELFGNARTYLHYPISPAEFLEGQIFLIHPLLFPLWLAGLYFYLVSKDGKHYRALGWAYVAILCLLVGLRGKIYYLAPAYAMLLASGAVVTEKFVERRRWFRLRRVIVASLLIGGIAAAPYALPVLPVEAFLRYERVVGMPDAKVEQGQTGALPQQFAYMFGWENMAAEVARVYRRLPSEQQTRCAILASDYAQAGAIDFFGRRYKLPKAISGYQNYYLWGPGDYSGELMITIGFAEKDLRPVFHDVRLAALIRCNYCWPDQTNLPVFICRGLKMPLREFWPKVKCYSCENPPFIAEGRRSGDRRMVTDPHTLDSAVGDTLGTSNDTLAHWRQTRTQ